MKSNEILYSKGKNDERYTPDYAVYPILKYIPESAIVWCPFDKKESEFVKLISITNKVILSHIEDGGDFYQYEPKEHWDMIISNPPFTNKKRIFERALSFNKPFALLMTVAWLNDSAPIKLFKGKEFELMLFDKRVEYSDNPLTPPINSVRITFASAYYCHKFFTRKNNS